MREKARRLIFKYVNEHKTDLTRTWATERPFELYLDGVVVSGRADVIYDEHDGVIDNLAIVDYKTATGGEIDPLQLQVYADAGRREGLTVAAAFVHDMGTTTRHDGGRGDDAIANAERTVVAAAQCAEGAGLHAEARRRRSAPPATSGRYAAPHAEVTAQSATIAAG